MRKTFTKTTALLALLLLLIAPSLADTGSAQNAFASFIRYSPTPGELDTSVVTFENSKGQQVDLISAVHVADGGYYKNLNNRFKNYDTVLYELILPDDMAGQQLPAQMSSSSGVSGIQGMLARSLGLTTQLDRINYSPKNFKHADLTQSGLSQKMAERKESLATYLMQALMKSASMDEKQLGISEAELASIDLASVMSGTSSAKDRKVLKKLFASALSSSGGLLSAMSDSAIIAERNKVALNVLDKQVQQGDRRMAIFVGAAHMPDMAQRLRKNGWKRTKTDWLTAWTI